jgi:Regulator of polyketide synthase expression
MKLSMWILTDWLKDYKPLPRIRNGKPVLKNARLYTSDTGTRNSHVYIGRAKELIKSDENKVVCIHEQDTVLLETENTEQVFNDILNAFDYYNDWFETLNEQITAGCTLQYLLDSARYLFDDFISIADPAYAITAFSVPETYDLNNDFFLYIINNKTMPLDVIMDVNRDSRIREVNRTEAYIIENKFLPDSVICANLEFDNQHYGWITMLAQNHLVTQGKLDVFSTYAKLIEYWLRCNKTQSELKSFQGFFLDLLNGHSGTQASINQHFQAIGWNPSDEKMIVSVICLYEKDIMLTLSRRIEKWFPACLGVFYEDAIVVICNLALMKKSEFMAKFKEISTPSKCLCGISYVFSETAQAPLYYAQTIIAMKYGDHSPGSLNECSDYAVAYGLDIVKQHVQTDIKHPAIKVLQKYDQDTHSDLTETLKIFLKNERNYTNAAKILCIHKNSLKYRLSRINDLTSIDLNSYETRLHLLLSFYFD